ncbi:molybdopterin-dependent oxidoreductase [Paenibacillus xerothermodurans]|uniref:Oxidoreductase molybdopterin-binding domain-containing protein n=1 Tax=Paenibacillus xerothermodurans TaxID=1977292 RepID=A0A2W1P132_PAEXE|nr:molybdopterin-dependent oxidoreductase [Paenibacillus xerothermodurans]PZE21442.1 hypothetical protein CBW46_008835 [Paenibacillus xerothermodurans]
MEIKLYDEQNGKQEISVEELTKLAPLHVDLDERVPGAEGKAFDLKAWYRAWRNERGVPSAAVEPTHMTVEAADEFRATIPWNQLDQAVFLYEQNGSSLEKGYPIRLYVPDGSSECLNVKSVIHIHFGYHEVPEKAAYGFKNQVSVEELKLRKL